jgi:hypothetical protein
MFKTTCASIALVALTNPALAAGSCATSADVAALKTAVINQELMVAAFQCHEVNAYNRFVTTYKRELQSSDAVLKAYFVRSKHGEAGYDSFKTKAANLSALEQARHSGAGTRAKNAPVPVTARAEVADIGVPAHSLPALSYRRVIAAAPAPEDLQDSDNPSYAYNREYEARGYNGYPPRTNGSPRSAPRDR